MMLNYFVRYKIVHQWGVIASAIVENREIKVWLCCRIYVLSRILRIEYGSKRR